LLPFFTQWKTAFQQPELYFSPSLQAVPNLIESVYSYYLSPTIPNPPPPQAPPPSASERDPGLLALHSFTAPAPYELTLFCSPGSLYPPFPSFFSFPAMARRFLPRFAFIPPKAIRPSGRILCPPPPGFVLLFLFHVPPFPRFPKTPNPEVPPFHSARPTIFPAPVTKKLPFCSPFSEISDWGRPLTMWVPSFSFCWRTKICLALAFSVWSYDYAVP